MSTRQRWRPSLLTYGLLSFHGPVTSSVKDVFKFPLDATDIGLLQARLKKICFRSSDRVTKKGETRDFFFSFLQKKKRKIFKNEQYFPAKQKKKLPKRKIAAAQTGHNYGHPLDQKPKFFLVRPDRRKVSPHVILF